MFECSIYSFSSLLQTLQRVKNCDYEFSELITFCFMHLFLEVRICMMRELNIDVYIWRNELCKYGCNIILANEFNSNSIIFYKFN